LHFPPIRNGQLLLAPSYSNSPSAPTIDTAIIVLIVDGKVYDTLALQMVVFQQPNIASGLSLQNGLRIEILNNKAEGKFVVLSVYSPAKYPAFFGFYDIMAGFCERIRNNAI